MYVCRIVARNNEKVPLTYHRFQDVISSLGPPPEALDGIDNRLLEYAYTPLSDDHDEQFGVPTLEELGEYCFRSPKFYHVYKYNKTKLPFLACWGNEVTVSSLLTA